jgi:hypothetical protein
MMLMRFVKNPNDYGLPQPIPAGIPKAYGAANRKTHVVKTNGPVKAGRFHLLRKC